MFKHRQFEASEVVFAIACIVLLAQFGLALSEYAQHAQAALTFPFPLDYTEGPVLDQVLSLARFESIYRSDFSSAPYTVSSNPPLFPLIQVPFVQVFGLAFWYGRAISLLSALLAALFIALTVQTLTDDWIAASISGLTLLAIPYLLQGSVLDRADSLALALSWAGLFSTVRWPNHSRNLILPVLLFVAALYTKLLYGLVAGLTALIWLLLGKRNQQALWLASLLGGIVAGLFLLLNWITQGGFALSIAAGTFGEFSLQNLLANAIDLYFHVPYLVLGSAMFIFMERLGDQTRSWPLVMPYVLLTALSTVTIGKAGSVTNDLYLPAAALCLVAGALVAWPTERYWLKAMVVLVLALQVNSLVNLSREEYIPFVMTKVKAASEIRKLAQLVQDAPDRVLADEYMGLVPLSGHRLAFQPVEFSQLSRIRLWDDRALIASIRRREFAAILLYEPRDTGALILNRWTPRIAEAIWASYRLQTMLADVWVYVPKEGS
jgi:hypothetical protein